MCQESFFQANSSLVRIPIGPCHYKNNFWECIKKNSWLCKSSVRMTNAVRLYILGNLCRCTGYRPILDGFNTFAKDYECPLGEDCCRNGTPISKDATKQVWSGMIWSLNQTEDLFRLGFSNKQNVISHTEIWYMG